MIYKYEWEDKSISIVVADNKESAWHLLDEIGGAEMERIVSVPSLNKRGFMITYGKGGYDELEDFQDSEYCSDEISESLMEVLNGKFNKEGRV